jgi:hypothetical protein
MEQTATKLLLVPQHEIFLLRILAQPGTGGRVNMDQHRPILEAKPEISLWSSVADLRYFQGVIGLSDVAQLAMEFASTRA